MFKKVIIACFTVALSSTVSIAQDSLGVQRIYNMEGIVITSPKSFGTVKEMPAAVSVIPGSYLEQNNIDETTGLSVLVPNLYMPGYGSKLTSAIYIRGVGSRMNDPAVGMYVDDVPYLDKSMYDFDFFDIAGIEMLRGPQGTLYGRNAMAGIVNIRTMSPLHYKGVKASLSYGTANSLNANVVNYSPLGKKAGLSAGVNFRRTDGFFTNKYDGSPVDELWSGGARIRFDWQLSNRWLFGYTVNGEISEQKGYPYGLVDQNGKVGDVRYNDKAGYDRKVMVNSMTWKYTGRRFALDVISSYQFLDDDMRMDQDFTEDDVFTLQQKQKQHAFTQEVVARSNGVRNYKWLFGAFGFYKKLKVESPVMFKRGGVAMIQQALDDAHSGNPMMPMISIVDGDGSDDAPSLMPTNSFFKLPSQGAAIYHQSTFDNLLFDGFSVIAGVRLDYEKVMFDYRSFASSYFKIVMSPQMGGRTMWQERVVDYDGKISDEFFEFLPKLAVRYVPSGRNYTLYASVARGYTAGGFNYQLFSDLVSGKFRESSQEAETPSELKNIVAYKPEYNWNYEVGGRVDLLAGHLSLDVALFFIQSRNQQISQMVETGLGRIMKNAGRSESYGVEISLNGREGGLEYGVNYGYAHATFRKYEDYTTVDGNLQPVDYKGKFIPMAPRHTISARVDYTFRLRDFWLDKLVLGVQYTGAGKIYFNETNDDAQDFYSLLNASITLWKKNYSIMCWARNITDSEYKLFSFDGLYGRFAQLGNPFQMGVTLRKNW